MMKTTIKKIRGNEKGLALIWTYLTSVSLLALMVGFYSFASNDTKILASDSANLQAFYLAEAGIDQKIVELRNHTTSSIGTTNFCATANFGDGATDGNTSGTCNTSRTIGAYSVLYDNLTGVATSTATVGPVTRKVYTKISNTSQSIPPGVYGALTFLNGVTLAAVDSIAIQIDGGENAPGIAIYTGTASYVPGLPVTVGGMGITPSNPANPLALYAVEQNTYLTNPNVVLGLPQESTALSAYDYGNPDSTGGTQKNYTISGLNQVKMITAVDDFYDTYITINGSGILIVNAASGSLVYINGIYSGLIICNCSSLTSNGLHLTGAFVNTHASQSQFLSFQSPFGTPSDVQITYDETVLKNLPAIQGASYILPETFSAGWSDGSKNGPNPLIYQQYTLISEDAEVG